MPVEVRQLVIRAEVEPPAQMPQVEIAADFARMRAEILAECRALIDQCLSQQRER